MPFRSKRQVKKFFAMEARHELPKGTAERWAHHTKEIKSLPETAHKKESAAYRMGEQVALSKKAGPMAWLGRKAIMPAVKGMAKPVEWALGKLPGKAMAGAAESVGGYRAGLGKAMLEPAEGLFKGKGKAEALEKFIGHQKMYGGIGTAAVGIPALATILAAVSHGRRRKAEEALKAEMAAGEAKEGQLGTPFMDGFLIQCAEAGLNEKQTADAIEKAAQAEGVVGKECKAFLERLAGCND